MILVLNDWVESIVRKGENAGNYYFTVVGQDQTGNNTLSVVRSTLSIEGIHFRLNGFDIATILT